MLSAYFDPQGRRIRVLREGPSGPLFEAFAHALLRAGYPAGTARQHIGAAEHVLHWSAQRRRPVGELNEQSLRRFEWHLRRCRCRYRHADRTHVLYGARLFVRVLREIGTITTPMMNEAAPDPVLLRAFCQWMHEQRGTCEATLASYARPIRALLARLGEKPREFDARSLRGFVLERSGASGWAAAKTCTIILVLEGTHQSC